MKFREKSRQEGQILYVPEELSTGQFKNPSAIFINTLRSMKELGFADKSDIEVNDFADKCKAIISNLK